VQLRLEVGDACLLPGQGDHVGAGGMICGSSRIGAATRTGPWVVQAVA